MRAAVGAEWVKIRTVRSTGWSLVPAFVLSVGLGILACLSIKGGFDRMDEPARANFDPVLAGFYSLTIGQIAMVVFGVLLAGGEYTTGLIRASLTAMPRRGVFYVAKVLAGAATALAVSLVTGYVTFFAGQAALGAHGVAITDPGAFRAATFAGLYLTLICLFAMGVATMLRGTALAMGIMIPLLFLDSQGLGYLPGFRTVAQFLPDQAGLVMMRVVTPDRSFISYRAFGPWTALGIVLAWTAAALAGGYLVLRRRDA
jgi:ABC-2 type transport system permease protein